MALGAIALGGCCVMPVVADATPTAQIGCRTILTRATPTPDDSNLTNYSFHCSRAIQSYTLIVNRTANDFTTVDDFNTAPSVYNYQQTQINPTETVDCSATTTPGDGINCFAQSASTPATIDAYNWIDGNLDTTDPFCGHPAKGRNAAEPAAVVQLVVTDATGAEWGPFPMRLAPGCPKPYPIKPKPKHKKPNGRRHRH